MKKQTKVAVGLVLIVGALYGGAAAVEFLPKWMEMPSVMTACLVGFWGCAITTFSLITPPE